MRSTKNILNIAYLLIIALTLFTSFSVSIIGIGESLKISIVPTADGRFYKFENQGDCCIITSYNGKADARENYLNNFRTDFILTSGNISVAVENKNETLTLFKFDDGRNNVYYIENVKLKDNCIAMTNDLNIYLAETGADNVIRRFLTADYEVDAIKTPGKINYLFTDIESGTPYAALSDGIYNAEDGSFIKCDVPAYPLKSNSGYYSDRNGCIYTFSSAEGFKKILSLASSAVCTTDSGIVCLSDNRVYMMNFDGKEIGKYDLSKNAYDVYASKSYIAVVSDSGVDVLTPDNFTYDSSVDEKKVKSVQKNDDSINNNDKSQKSEEKKSNYSSNENLQDLQQSNSAIVNYNVEILNNSYNASDKGLKSTCYEIYKDIINVPCGTTVSKLKKNLSYGEGRLVITNHSGKPAGSGKIGTGWTIEVYYGNQKFIYYTCVKGDLTGEGNINTLDLRALADYLQSNMGFESLEKTAADFNGDGRLDILDVYQIQKYSLSL